MEIFYILKKKVHIKCYKAYRYFQNLPANGQRTSANAGTPSLPYNPLVKLGLDPDYVKENYLVFKDWEMKLNHRKTNHRLLSSKGRKNLGGLKLSRPKKNLKKGEKKSKKTIAKAKAKTKRIMKLAKKNK